MINQNIHTMKQPALGKRISELRKEKGLTQEELVEQCNINVRTIQRIEAGEVNPRSYTIKTILEVLGQNSKMISETIESEESKYMLSKDDAKNLNMSWVFGIFYIVVCVAGVIMETYFITKSSTNTELLLFRLPYSIAFFILLIYFLNGYKILAKKFNNSLLVNAVNTYYILSVLMLVATIFTSGSGLLSPLEIILSVFIMLVSGIGELVMGIGIMKLKTSLGSSANTIGVLKIVNGSMFITILLSPIAVFIMIPILIVEVVFLHNISSKFKTTHDDTAHS